MIILEFKNISIEFYEILEKGMKRYYDKSIFCKTR